MIYQKEAYRASLAYPKCAFALGVHQTCRVTVFYEVGGGTRREC